MSRSKNIYQFPDLDIDAEQLKNELQADIMMFLKIATRRIEKIHTATFQISKGVSIELKTHLNKFAEMIQGKIFTEKESIETEIENISKEVLSFVNDNVNISELVNIEMNTEAISDEYNLRIKSIFELINKAEKVHIKLGDLKANSTNTVSSLDLLGEVNEKNLILYNADKAKMIRHRNYIEDEKRKEIKDMKNETILIKKEFNGLIYDRDQMKMKLQKDQQELANLRYSLAGITNDWNEINSKLMTYDQIISEKQSKVEKLDKSIMDKTTILNELSNKLTSNIKDAANVKDTITELNVRDIENILESSCIHFYDSQTNDFLMYNLELQKMFKLSDKDYSPPLNYDSLQIGSKIYITGGFDSGLIEFYKSTVQLEIVKDYSINRTKKADMNFPKSQHKVIALNANTIYCLGGKNKSNKCLNVCEYYDIEKDQWTIGPPLIKPRFFLSAVAFNFEIIYTFGGFNSTPVKDIEMLNPTKENRWESVKVDWPDWSAREESAAIQISKNEILIFGGIDSYSGSSDDTFIYEPNTPKLVKVKTSLKKKEWFAMRNPIKYKGKVYILGYYTNSLHIFDISKRIWDMIDSKTIFT